MLLHEKWLHVSAICNRGWKVRWEVNVDGRCTLHVSVDNGWDAKHGNMQKMEKHVFSHGGMSVYGKAKLEWSLRENELYSHLWWKGESNYMEDKNDNFVTFQKVTLSQNWGFEMQLYIWFFM